MPKILIDREMLVEKIYELRSKIDSTQTDAMKEIDSLILIVQNAPVSEKKSSFPKIGFQKG